MGDGDLGAELAQDFDEALLEHLLVSRVVAAVVDGHPGHGCSELLQRERVHEGFGADPHHHGLGRLHKVVSRRTFTDWRHLSELGFIFSFGFLLSILQAAGDDGLKDAIFRWLD